MKYIVFFFSYSVTALPVDSTSKKGQVSGQLPGSVQTGPQQQSQQLLLTPASLQLAQLQAQLTLQRLKLAQGGNTAAAATILNQVLSNVAMSQPLFNQLRTSPVVGNPQGTFPTGVLAFPSSNSAMGSLVGGAYHQNPGNVRLNHPVGGGTVGQQGDEYTTKSGAAYPSDTDRRLQYNLAGVTSAPSATAGDGHYAVINTQAKNMNNVSYQRDIYVQDMQQQAGFSVNEQNRQVYNSPGNKEQWKGPASVSHTGKLDMVSNATAVWTAAGQPLRSHTELYNPEEPTPDPKFNHSSGGSSLGSSGTQGFGGYQPLQGSEESRTLQPYQVNDYHAVTPAQLPHQCSICDKKVYNLKVSELASLKLNARCANVIVHQKVNMIIRHELMSAHAYKNKVNNSPFPPRKTTVGRVVHICNLPEGSCTENDVINLGLPFGKVTNYILMRSTHQAFLEMAYVEAAQAMVQYYQLTPATIHNQKLLIRMSKRYKELQLKVRLTNKVNILDLLSYVCSYMPERARSRSPISRSMSPHSHSPSFTSCSSAHSPQGPPVGRVPERSNSLGPCRVSWDWPSHSRRGEDERERDDPWRNGGNMDDDWPNGRGTDRRKAYQKPLDHINRMRGNRNWHSQGSPQGLSFNIYRNMEDDFHTKEQMYKSDKPPRPPYQRHDAKLKRRDGGDYHGRPRHSEFEMSEETVCRTSEERRQSSPGRGRSKRTSRRHASEENGADTDEESWYPKNMEELVTVDEVGGEDDSIIEPDLPELEEYVSCPKESTEEEAAEKNALPAPALEEQNTLSKRSDQDEACGNTGDQAETSSTEKTGHVLTESSSEQQEVRIEAPSPSPEQDKAVSEHSIPLGVEFIVPRTGFFCKLCGLFYTSEENAKIIHCRSTVHYRNLQVHTAQRNTSPSADNDDERSFV
uniref:RNA binding motif protein 20 n=1 Tax=Echeneis naucrates TaxID=173247 RepID=A0A665WR37_ECHNA